MNPNVNLKRRSIVLGGLMAATSVGAVIATPKPQVTSESQMPNLERLVPEVFGSWVIDKSIVPLTVSPEVAQMLGNIYDRTLSRTYVNGGGQRVMLSIAYGANQSRALQLHKPEVCYASQGFRVSNAQLGQWQFDGMTIPTMHLVGSLGQRTEPVTYWMRIGDDIARGWFEQNKVRLKYGTRGQIPDGVLFRLSTIAPDPKAAYVVQRDFAQEMLHAMSPAARAVFLGSVALGKAG